MKTKTSIACLVIGSLLSFGCSHESVVPTVEVGEFGGSPGVFRAAISGFQFEVTTTDTLATYKTTTAEGYEGTATMENFADGFEIKVSTSTDGSLVMRTSITEDGGAMTLSFDLNGDVEEFVGEPREILALVAQHRLSERPAMSEVDLLTRSFAVNTDLRDAYSSSLTLLAARGGPFGWGCGLCCSLCAFFLLNGVPDPGDFVSCGWCFRCAPVALN